MASDYGPLLHGMFFAQLIYENPKDGLPGSRRFLPSQEHCIKYLLTELLDTHVGISLGIDAQEWNCGVLGLGDLNLTSSKLNNLMGYCPELPLASHQGSDLLSFLLTFGIIQLLLFASWICTKWVPCCFDLLLSDQKGFSCAWYVSEFSLLCL